MPIGRDKPLLASDAGTRRNSVRLERRVALGIAAFVPSFGLIGVVAMLSVDGPEGPFAKIACSLVLVSTVPVGVWWFRRSADSSHMPGWFVVYADVGVAAMLLTFAGRDLALNGAILFTVIGIYIVYFSRRRVLEFHMLFVNAVVVVLAALLFAADTHDAASTVTRTLATLLVVNSVLAFRAVIQRQLDLANTDSLTGLLNRRGLELRLQRMMNSMDAECSVALMVLDLDQFKRVNDTYGHAVGDRVLRRTARRLTAVTGTRPCVARTGGEEFTIALPVDDAAAHRIAHEILESIHDPADDVPVTVSVGVALLDGSRWFTASESGDSAGLVHNVLLDADTAMYESKHAGGNRATVYAGE
ncbi:GGDEF domain-containing protein [Rhodococcus sp. IEGM 1401]|uniref:GGDEF domain-containing protein n=1 Tax=unclassified Rhodococcus (in: high G+C Gram-positive bacteria) TaxID=192944 RepID=UPI0022B381E7|nr:MULTISPECIES: GGDEF domain-containing protein [unclassified Rhodococcus (in: high G+C Gram-positive bacteria)]MCZ4562823.1 GGDEF domain-containing protein [Rhodococcus sp. IEGM 1401]MDI9922946.1 GGDEF domain-containing protein [Rhodococcus sp. IEGM 1372]MDV8035462.1 GGDEF domain-containing protein [Rhodococcus sp. IEGM 1414]